MKVKSTTLPAHDVLRQAADLFEQRAPIYGSNYWKCAAIMQMILPEGTTLQTEEDFIRHQFLEHIVNKLTRYGQNFNKCGHEDSSLDSVVYWSMLHAADREYEMKKVKALVNNTVKGRKKK